MDKLRFGRAACAVERAALIKDSLGLCRGKTDKLDSKRIALFAYKNREDARLWAPPRQVISQLDRLTAQRARLTKAIKLLKTPLANTEGFLSKEDRKANGAGRPAASLYSFTQSSQSRFESD